MSAVTAASASARAVLDQTLIHSVTALSPLERSRLQWQPALPQVLKGNFRLQQGQATDKQGRGAGWACAVRE